MVYNDAWYLHRFRGRLMRTLRSRGCNVMAIAPKGRAVGAIEEEGIRFINWSLTRRSTNPLTEMMSILKLWAIYRKTRPHLAQHFTPKPNIYGAFAARLAGVPVVVASVNGLGYIFSSGDLRATVVRPIVKALYRLAFALTDTVIFQNQDDVSVLHGLGLIPMSKVRHFTGGSGVDTQFFSPDSVDVKTKRELRESIGLPENSKIVLMAARMLWDKGVAAYVECAQGLTQSHDVQFLLAGPVDDGNPAAVPKETLKQWDDDGFVRYVGERGDIRELIGLSDVLVLPSAREGTPRILIEGAAMAKPIVATDVAGCRDVVEHGTNGFLVPVDDVDALVKAITELLENSELRLQYGENGRKRAMDEFDDSKTTARILELYNTLLVQKGLQPIPSESQATPSP